METNENEALEKNAKNKLLNRALVTWETISSKLCVTGVQQRWGRASGKIIEEIMAKKIPNLMKMTTHRSKKANKSQAEET